MSMFNMEVWWLTLLFGYCPLLLRWVFIYSLFAKSIKFRENHTPKLISTAPHLGLKLDMFAFEAATNSVTC